MPKLVMCATVKLYAKFDRNVKNDKFQKTRPKLRWRTWSLVPKPSKAKNLHRRPYGHIKSSSQGPALTFLKLHLSFSSYKPTRHAHTQMDS